MLGEATRRGHLVRATDVVRAASRAGTCGSCVIAGHGRTGHQAADLPLLLLQLAWGASQKATIWPGDGAHVRAPLCVLLQHTLTLETKCKLGTSPRPPSYSAIPFSLPAGVKAAWPMSCVHRHLLPQLFSFLLTSPPSSFTFQHFFLYFLVLPTPACYFFFPHC